VGSHGGSQDQGSFEVYDSTGTVQITGDNSGPTLKLVGNTWKYIDLPAELRTIVSGYTIEFEYNSTTEGEIHGIVFNDDDSVNSGDQPNAFCFAGQDKSWGTSGWTGNYTIGSGWQDFSIVVSDYIAVGTVFNRLVFIADDDNNGGSNNGYFRDVTITIPEPSTLALAALGLFSLAACGWRRRK
jgi:hypothetical protein